VERAGVLASLRAAGGRRGKAFSIAIEDAQARDLGGQHVLATYVERQQDASSRTARRSSALFYGSAAAPRGVAWLHLHETWIAMPS
jgi:hypothetical protein